MHENREKHLKYKRILKPTNDSNNQQKGNSNECDPKLEKCELESKSQISESTNFPTHQEEEKYENNKEPSYVCKLCPSNSPNSKFSKKIQLRIHERKFHLKDKNTLPGEMKTNKFRTQLMTIFCDSCSYECISRSALEKHILAVHKKERPHACPECGKRFTQTSHVNYHLKTVHAQPGTVIRTKSHPCHECGAKFATSSTLRKHQRTHTGTLVKLERIPFSAFHLYKKPTSSIASNMFLII